MNGGSPVKQLLQQGITAVTRAKQSGPSNRKHEKERCEQIVESREVAKAT